MIDSRAWLKLVASLTVVASLTGCAVPFLHRGSDGVRAPKAAKAAKVAKAAKSSKTKTALAVAKPTEVVEADDAPTWFRRAERQLTADSVALAERSLRTALQKDAGYSPALALMSKLDFQAGRHADAIERLAIVHTQPARFRDEELALLLAGLALHQDALGQTREARETLKRAPATEEKRTGSARVYVLLRGETPDEATDVASRTLDRDSKSAVNLNNRGITQLRAGDPESARRTFLQAIDRDPALAGPYYNLAILEKFYALDDVAAARWYGSYRERSSADPDGLADVFRASERKPVAQEGQGR